MKLNFLLILLIFFALQSCNKSNDLDDKEIEHKEKPILQFTTPPFEIGDIDAKFSKDISYGLHDKNKFDIFMPKSDNPVPLVIYIHGGYFTMGDKSKAYNNVAWGYPEVIKTLLKNNIAFVTINYRLVNLDGDNEGVIKSLSDSKRCLQYIRAISDVLNIDENKIVLTGQSAGAGTSQWLAFSDDIANPSSSDYVLRESTRVKGIAVRATQATYDLLRFESDVFDDFNFSWIEYFKLDPSIIPRFETFYGMDNLEDFYSDNITQYRKNVDMLGLMSSDDPEFWAANPEIDLGAPRNLDVLVHHAFHVRTMKEWADSIGIPNVVYYGNYKDSSGENVVDFMIRKLNE